MTIEKTLYPPKRTKSKTTKTNKPDVRQNNEQTHEEDLGRIDKLDTEKDFGVKKKRYRKINAQVLVALVMMVLLFITIITFGILIATVEKERIEPLIDFATNTVIALIGLTGIAMGIVLNRGKGKDDDVEF